MTFGKKQTIQLSKKDKRRQYNLTYYNKNRFKILKTASDKKDKVKGKIKLALETNLSPHITGLENSCMHGEDKV